jgi:membrane-associated PAP2 superfamily phosphatase
VLPGLVALVVLGAFEATNLDRAIQDHFYDPVARKFPLAKSHGFELVFHDLGKLPAIALGVGCALGYLASFRRERLRPWRKQLLFVALCLGLGPLAVAGIKSRSVIHCPRDLAIYGKDAPYVRLFDPVPSGLEPGQCWPGGHSSGGFAVMSVYLALRRRRPRAAKWWLGGGFLYGLTLGTSRMVQGAHFVSHNLWAAVVCWAVALALYELILRRDDQRASHT